MRLRSAVLLASLVSLPLSTFAQEKTGAEVYETVCSDCHGTGKHDAPVFGDRKRWGKLVREGFNDLVPAALRGIRKMPAMGGNPALTDLEVARAVVHMANAGGAKFSEPKAPEAAK